MVAWLVPELALWQVFVLGSFSQIWLRMLKLTDTQLFKMGTIENIRLLKFIIQVRFSGIPLEEERTIWEDGLKFISGRMQ